jgi:hypothetical protein
MTCERCNCAVCAESRIKTLGDLPPGSLVLIDRYAWVVNEHELDSTTMVRYSNRLKLTFASSDAVTRVGDWYQTARGRE